MKRLNSLLKQKKLPERFEQPDEKFQRILEFKAKCKLHGPRRSGRRDLAEKGFSATVIHGLQLATEEELALAEEEVLGDEDDLPTSWRRSV